MKCVYLTVWLISIYYVSATLGSTTPSPTPPAADLSLTTSNSTLYVGFTEMLSLNCSFPHDENSQFGGVISIIVSKTDGPLDTDFREIAIISVLSRQGLEIKDDLGGQVQGIIALEGVAYISYDWSEPTSDAAGQYRCAVNGLDPEGHPVTKSITASIEEKNVTVQMALDKIKQLKSIEEQLIDELNTTQSQLNSTTDYCVETTGNLTSELSAAMARANVAESQLQITSAQLVTTAAQLNHTSDALAETRDNLTTANQQLGAVSQLLVSKYSSLVYKNHLYVMSDETMANVTSFQETCRGQDGYLVEIDNQQEYDELKQFIRKLNIGKSSIYIGLTDEGHEGRWTYLTSGKVATFIKWSSGQPDGSTGQNCAQLDNAAGLAMADYDCVSSFLVRFICEIPCGRLLPCA